MKILPIKITGLKPSLELRQLAAHERIVLAVIPNAQGDEFTHILYPKTPLIDKVKMLFSSNPAVKIESLSKKEMHK